MQREHYDVSFRKCCEQLSSRWGSGEFNQVSSGYLPCDPYLGLKVLSVTWAQRGFFSYVMCLRVELCPCESPMLVLSDQTNPRAFISFFFFF